jgi:hypothetical protein
MDRHLARRGGAPIRLFDKAFIPKKTLIHRLVEPRPV